MKEDDVKILGLGLPELLIIAIPLLVWLIVALVCCVICIGQAEKKGYSVAGFGLMGFFLSIIGLIIALILPDRKAQRTFQAAEELAAYKRLLDQGAITQEEFERKKRELL